MPYPPPGTAGLYPTSEQQEVIPVCPLSRADGPYPIPCIHVNTPGPSPTPPPIRIIDIRMFYAQTGWAVDSNGHIQRTAHGVQSWMNVTPPVKAGYQCPFASFVDENTAIVLCRLDYMLTPWRTINAGQTWESDEQISTDSCDFDVVQLVMLDSVHGWMWCVASYNQGNAYISIFTTLDGGMHWSLGYKTSNQDENRIEVYDSYTDHLAPASETVAFFSNGILYASNDGGNTLVVC